MKRDSRKTGLFFSLRSRMVALFGLLFFALFIASFVIEEYGLPIAGFMGDIHERRTETFNKLNLLADLKKNRLEAWLQERTGDAKMTADDEQIALFSQRIGRAIQHVGPDKLDEKKITALVNADKDYAEVRRRLRSIITIYEHPGFYKSGKIIDGKTGRIIVSTKDDNLGTDDSDQEYFQSPLKSGQMFAGITKNDKLKEPELYVSLPIKTGVLELQMNLDSLLQAVSYVGSALGKTGEVVILNNKGTIIQRSKSKPGSGTAETREYRIGGIPGLLAASGKEGAVEATDYRGVKVMATYRYIPITGNSGWGLVVKQDFSEISAQVYKDVFIKSAINFTALLIILTASWRVAKGLSEPIENLSNVAKNVGVGNYGFVAQPASGEVGVLADNINLMTSQIRDRQNRLETEMAERQKTVIELVEKETALSEAQRLAHLGGWDWDLAKNRLALSKEGFQILGVSESEFGATYEAFLGFVHPGDITDVRNGISKAVYENVRFSQDHRILRPDGGERTVHNQAEAVLKADGKVEKLTGVLQDITERKSLEQKIADAFELNRKVITDSPIGIIIYDSDGRCVMANDATGRVTGLAITQILTQNFNVLKQFVDADVVRDGLEALRSGKEKRREVLLYTPQQREIWVEMLFARIMPGEKPHLILMMDDITEKREAQEKLLNLNMELEERVTRRTAALNAANKELEAFAYSISHDLRAPLRAINGFSVAVMEDYADKLDEKGVDYLKRIRASALRMSDLIDDLLVLSRITRDEMHLGHVNISDVVESAAEELRDREPNRKVEIKIQHGLGVKGDAKLLRLAMDNLLGNAWKFTSKTPEAKIEFGAEKVGDEMAFFLRDNGAGFDAGYKDILFLPFHRLHTNTEFEGSGIGLATVKRIITRHGGRIWGEGEVGKGAVFYFTI